MNCNKPFWKGFEKQGARGSLKRHVVVLYWDESNRGVKELLNRVRLRHPTVQFKAIEGSRDPRKVQTHRISTLPTILLLRDGREVDRISGAKGASSTTLLEELFRKAAT